MQKLSSATSVIRYSFHYLILDDNSIGSHSIAKLSCDVNREITDNEYNDLHQGKSLVKKQYGAISASRAVPITEDVFDDLHNNGLPSVDPIVRIADKIPSLALFTFFWFCISLFFYLCLKTDVPSFAYIVKEVLAVVSAIGLTQLFHND